MNATGFLGSSLPSHSELTFYHPPSTPPVKILVFASYASGKNQPWTPQNRHDNIHTPSTEQLPFGLCSSRSLPILSNDNNNDGVNSPLRVFRTMTIEKVRTYVEGFDELLGGGIPKGSSVLICGAPGTMKTSLAYSVLHANACNGSKGLFITLEESRDDLLSAMNQLGMENPGDARLHILDVGTVRRERNQEKMAKNWFEVLGEYIERRVEDGKFNLVAIDSLAALYSLSQMENPRRDLYHFFGSLKDLGTTTLLVSEMQYGKNQLTSYAEDFLADGIFLLRQQEVGETDVQLRIRCVKMRRARHHQGYLALLRENNRFVVTRVISERLQDL